MLTSNQRPSSHCTAEMLGDGFIWRKHLALVPQIGRPHPPMSESAPISLIIVVRPSGVSVLQDTPAKEIPILTTPRIGAFAQAVRTLAKALVKEAKGLGRG